MGLTRREAVTKAKKMLLMKGFLLTLLISALRCEEGSADQAKEDETPHSDGETVPEEDEKAEEEGANDSEIKEENGVIVLTAKNFDEVINDKDIILVKFYVSW